jgi:cytoskeletal protein CcmA (bactofilin family)
MVGNSFKPNPNLNPSANSGAPSNPNPNAGFAPAAANKSRAQGQDIYIGEGVVIQGTFVVPGKAEIHGTVNGEITADNLLVGLQGRITGVAKAREMDVLGEVHKEIHCEEYLHIRASGLVSGSLNYTDLEIDRGGRFAGSMIQKTTQVA